MVPQLDFFFKRFSLLRCQTKVKIITIAGIKPKIPIRPPVVAFFCHCVPDADEVPTEERAIAPKIIHPNPEIMLLHISIVSDATVCSLKNIYQTPIKIVNAMITQPRVDDIESFATALSPAPALIASVDAMVIYTRLTTRIVISITKTRIITQNFPPSNIFGSRNF